MPVGIEGLPVILQRAEAAQTVQALQQNQERAAQLAASAVSRDAGVQRDSVVADRPNVELDGLWSDEKRGEPWAESRGSGTQEEPPKPEPPPPSPDGRGAKIDVKA